MLLPAITLDMIPTLAETPAAFGAICAPLQFSGSSVFDIIVAAIVISG